MHVFMYMVYVVGGLWVLNDLGTECLSSPHAQGMVGGVLKFAGGAAALLAYMCWRAGVLASYGAAVAMIAGQAHIFLLFMRPTAGSLPFRRFKGISLFKYCMGCCYFAILYLRVFLYFLFSCVGGVVVVLLIAQ